MRECNAESPNRAAKGSILKEDEICCPSGYIIYLCPKEWQLGKSAAPYNVRKSRRIFVDGVEWKLYIIELSTIYDFHSTPSTNIHWNFNFRRLFSISVYYLHGNGWGSRAGKRWRKQSYLGSNKWRNIAWRNCCEYPPRIISISLVWPTNIYRQ